MTVALRHHTICSDTAEDCVDCVMGMFRDLLQAYETRELLSYQANQNILNGQYEDDVALARDKCEGLINNLYSVSVTDSWETFIRKI